MVVAETTSTLVAVGKATRVTVDLAEDREETTLMNREGKCSAVASVLKLPRKL